MSILVVDVGTSGLRAAVVRPDASVTALHYRAAPPSTPLPGLVEFDPAAMAAAVLEVATAALADAGPVDAVGITCQRASAVLWDRTTGEPLGPGIGWQDLRTVMDCITAKAEHHLALAPNQTATKAVWLLTHHAAGRDPSELCVGTVDSWIAWSLSGGSLHVTDHTNAGLTGLALPDASGWNARTCDLLGVPPETLPSIVDTSGIVGAASALPGAPPIAALVGDQQGSLVGQVCVRPGQAKITFGTGGMLDLCTGAGAPASAHRSAHGTFPIVAWSRAGQLTWGAEGIMLSAGSNVEWLVDDLGLLTTPAESHEVAARCDTTDGVVYVPALLGLGTPNWDYGARGALLGVTRGSGRAQLVRAVLEGVAHRGADLVEAAEADTGLAIDRLRVDGGMSANPTFVQALANATGRVVEVAPIADSTTLGAAFLAGLAVGTWSSFDDLEAAWHPSARVEPTAPLDRQQWAQAVERASRWIPELSALDF
jgi:glycerol kinase